jgi:hypothetical protein
LKFPLIIAIFAALDEIAPGTTVIVTDTPAVRKPVVDSTYFAAN